MKSRHLLHLCLVVALAAGTGIACKGRPVEAYSPTIDGGAGDWTGAPPPFDNLGHLSRGAGEKGEYIWRDLGGDERTDFGSPDSRVDLLEFRVTADGNALTMMATMTDIDQAVGNGAPQIQVAIDTDQIENSGTAYLGGVSDTSVDPQAEWEYLAITRFGSGNTDLTVWLGGFSTSIVTGAAVISDQNETIEFSLPWAALGMEGVPTHPLRFTVAVFRADATDQTWDAAGTSNALDALTHYGSPGASSGNTWDEVSDGEQNYYFDLTFEQDGDVYAPLLISEILYDPSGEEPAAEFIEIHNAGPLPAELAAFKMGDEEVVGGAEGMMRFPSGTLAAGEVVVLASNAGTFLSTYGFLPDYALNPSGESVPAMVAYPTWTNGTAINLDNSGDEVLLLDGRDTVIDVVEYEDDTPEWPDLAGTGFAVGDGSSMERRSAGVDTNDIAQDFGPRGNDGTPGKVLAFRVHLPLVRRDGG